MLHGTVFSKRVPLVAEGKFTGNGCERLKQLKYQPPYVI
jgi:hypothetical protein